MSWQDTPMRIREAVAERDGDAIWTILEPVVRAGETYPLPRDMDRQAALAYWFSPGHEVFIAENGNEITGTYFLKANQKGGGGHVANCGYMTALHATGQGVGRAMCEHSLERARERGERGPTEQQILHHVIAPMYHHVVFGLPADRDYADQMVRDVLAMA